MTTSVSTPATIHIQHPATQQVIVAAAAPTNTTRTAVVATAAPSNNGCRTATAVVANGGSSGGGNKFFLPLLPQHPVRPNELLHKQAVTAVTAAGSGDNKVILAASGEGGRLIPVQISTSNGGARPKVRNSLAAASSSPNLPSQGSFQVGVNKSHFDSLITCQL